MNELKVILEIGAFMEPDNYVLPFLGDDNYKVILIDAQPDILNRLKENVSEYNNVECFNYGVNLENVIKDFYFPSAKVSCNEGFSSAGTFNMDHYKNPIFQHRVEDLQIFNVECYTFHDLISKVGVKDKIELLVLDVETLDCDIIRSIDFSLVDIRTIIFEVIHVSEEKLNKTIRYLDDNGYKYSKRSSLDGSNLVCSKEEEGLNLVK
jgi:FkbM family methyltransferase